MDKCKNPFIVTSGKSCKALPLAAAVAIAGCGGGGSGGGDTTSVSSLSGSQKSLAVAYSVAGQATSLSDQAVNQAAGSASGSDDSQTFSAANTQDPFADCNAVDSSVAPGFLNEEGDILDVSTIVFPEPFIPSGITPSADNTLGQKSDFRGRANCLITESNIQLKVLGAFDIAQRENIDGAPGKRLVFAEAGGLGGGSLSFDNPPDVSKSMQLETSGTSFSIPAMRYRMHICNGCVNGDLSNWTGDPAVDITSVSFIEFVTEFSGTRSSIRLGTPDTPFVFQSALDTGGTGDIQLEVNGEYQVTNDGLEGCDFGATISTDTPNGPLFVDSFAGDTVTPTRGAIDITPAGSAETFTVEFPPGGGDPLVNGQPVSSEDLTAVSNCGFVGNTST